MSTITLVRHGQASAGTDNYDKLSTLGQQQAELLGAWWEKTGVKPTVAFAGSMERQQHTGQLALEHANLSNNLGIETLPELNEYTHTEVDRVFGQGLTSAGAEALTLSDYLGIMQRWRDADDAALDGVESWSNFMARGLSAIEQAHAAAGEEGHAILFTSGGVIANILGSIQRHPFDVIIDNIWFVRNASITTLLCNGNETRLLDFNRVSHLEQHNDASLITQI